MTAHPLAPSFDALVAPHRSALLAHCYQMTGSVHDAEDALQEALLRAWRSLESFEGRSSVRTWLFTIATNACRRLIEQRARRVLPVGLGPPARPGEVTAPALEERSWVTPFLGVVPDSPAGRYESKETVELAFVVALQLLPPRQRAALLLRDVLGFSAAETGAALDCSVPSANSALQRARRVLAEKGPRRNQQQALRSLGEAGSRDLVDRFVRHWEAGDVAALVRLLAADVEFSMPPQSQWFVGSDDVAAFLRAGPMAAGQEWRIRPISASGQPGCAFWGRREGGPDVFEAESITVLTLAGGSIGAITAFRSPELFAAAGLPVTLPATLTSG